MNKKTSLNMNSPEGTVVRSFEVSFPATRIAVHSQMTVNFRLNHVNASRRPFTTMKVDVGVQNEVTQFDRRLRSSPFSSVLKSGDVFSHKSSPENWRQVLHMTPPSLRILIFRITVLDACDRPPLERQQHVWGECRRVIQSSRVHRDRPVVKYTFNFAQ